MGRRLRDEVARVNRQFGVAATIGAPASQRPSSTSRKESAAAAWSLHDQVKTELLVTAAGQYETEDAALANDQRVTAAQAGWRWIPPDDIPDAHSLIFAAHGGFRTVVRPFEKTVKRQKRSERNEYMSKVTDELNKYNNPHALSWVRPNRCTLAVRGTTYYTGARPGMLYITVSVRGMHAIKPPETKPGALPAEYEPLGQDVEILAFTHEAPAVPEGAAPEVVAWEYTVPYMSTAGDASPLQRHAMWDMIYAFLRKKGDSRARDLIVEVYALNDGDGYPGLGADGRPSLRATRFMHKVVTYAYKVQYRWLEREREELRYTSRAPELGQTGLDSNGTQAHVVNEGLKGKRLVVAVLQEPYRTVYDKHQSYQRVPGSTVSEDAADTAEYEQLRDAFFANGGLAGGANDAIFLENWAAILAAVVNKMTVRLADDASLGRDDAFLDRLDDASAYLLQLLNRELVLNPLVRGDEGWVQTYNRAATHIDRPTIQWSARAAAETQRQTEEREQQEDEEDDDDDGDANLTNGGSSAVYEDMD